MAHEISDEALAEILRKLKRYVGFRDIGKAAGVSYRTVYRVADDDPDHTPTPDVRASLVGLLKRVGALGGHDLLEAAEEIKKRADSISRAEEAAEDGHDTLDGGGTGETGVRKEQNAGGS